MAIRKKLETKVFTEGICNDVPTGIHINKEALISMAQHGSPSKIFPLFVLIAQNEMIKNKAFDLPDVVPSLPICEEVAQSPNLLDLGRWVDAIDSVGDALLAVQIGKTIFDRLPESYKKKAQEVV